VRRGVYLVEVAALRNDVHVALGGQAVLHALRPLRLVHLVARGCVVLVGEGVVLVLHQAEIVSERASWQ
jgi:hypothetical protein